MLCPKCNGLELQVSVTFQGYEDITCDANDPEKFEVTDNESTDSEWEDDSVIYCYACGHHSTVIQAKTAHKIALEESEEETICHKKSVG